MKRLFTLLFCIFFPLYSFGQNNNNFVQIWMTSYILDENQQLKISDHDYQALANLLFYSHARSVQTLDSQQIAYDSLQTTWKTWANMCATRLNPSKEKPFELYHEQVENLALLNKTIQHHVIANKTYTQVITEIVTGHYLQSSLAKKAVSEVRSQARQIISNALLDVKQHVKVLIENSKEISRSIRPAVPAIALCDGRELVEGSRTPNLETTRFLENIFPVLYAFGIQSFVEADELSLKVSNDAWDVLMQVQQSSLYVWQTIEGSRAAFYKTLYNTIRAASPKMMVTSHFEIDKILPVQIAAS